MDLMYPGVVEPTLADRIGAELADEQLDFIEDLKAIRLHRKMTVSDVAERMRVDPAQVSRFESGATNPTMATIRRYAKAVEAIFHINTQRWENHCTDVVYKRAQLQVFTTWETSTDDSAESNLRADEEGSLPRATHDTWAMFLSASR